MSDYPQRKRETSLGGTAARGSLVVARSVHPTNLFRFHQPAPSCPARCSMAHAYFFEWPPRRCRFCGRPDDIRSLSSEEARANTFRTSHSSAKDRRTIIPRFGDHFRGYPYVWVPLVLQYWALYTCTNSAGRLVPGARYCAGVIYSHTLKYQVVLYFD